LGVAVLAAASACAGGQPNAAEPSESLPPGTSVSATPSEISPTPPQASPSGSPTPEGESVSGDDWTLTLTGARATRRIEGTFTTAGYRVRPGFVFLIASVVLENLRAGRETKYANEDARLVDARGETYPTLGTVGGTLIEPGTGVRVTTSVPGTTITGEFVFAVAEEDEEATFELRFFDLPPIEFSVGEF
jgi:hypothetical protein